MQRDATGSTSSSSTPNFTHSQILNDTLCTESVDLPSRSRGMFRLVEGIEQQKGSFVLSMTSLKKATSTLKCANVNPKSQGTMSHSLNTFVRDPLGPLSPPIYTLASNIAHVLLRHTIFHTLLCPTESTAVTPTFASQSSSSFLWRDRSTKLLGSETARAQGRTCPTPAPQKFLARLQDRLSRGFPGLPWGSLCRSARCHDPSPAWTDKTWFWESS